MSAETIRVRGRVQGVGFRPFVWRLAREFAIRGEVLNDGEGVLVHAEGAAIDAFVRAIRERAPPLARIEGIERAPAPRGDAGDGFRIAGSAAGASRTAVAPDAVPCADCRAEIADPAARRHRYPFANCTHCGPRFSIVRSVPYDRATTTMAGFAMCPDCRAEYDDPADRRFHAQPIACPACGPRAWLEVDGRERPAADPVAAAVRLLADGRILAVKGIGGFHLACDARDEAAVARLRARKGRPTKPLALMAADLDAIRAHAAVSPEAARLLAAPEGPIVLLPAAGAPLAPSVAPGSWALGFMLPPTPLHRLIADGFGGPLVMTSGNRSGEPQATEEAQARGTLGAIADAFLMHDRPIARPLDDSLAAVVAGRAVVLRRGRGYAPARVPLPAGLATAPPVTAYGGQVKAALCLARDGLAIPSQHLGDLDGARAVDAFHAAERDLAALFDHDPAAIACDLHPDYRATVRARAVATALDLPLVAVQHHHAHVAAAMAESGWEPTDGPVLGVALDGLGLGDDGTLWGGEFLLADYGGFRRLARLRPVALPGGDAAARAPWRNLLAHLDACGLADAADRLLAGRPVSVLRAAVARGINAPPASSAGRLFDAVAAAAGLAPERVTFEGEAAMALETAARADWPSGEAAPYPFATVESGDLDPAPMWAALLEDLRRDAAPALIAARFHAGFAGAVADRARCLRRASGAGAIALSGGVFQNATLLGAILARLAGERVLLQSLTPPNDGGLALGQAAVAAARLVTGRPTLPP